MDQLESNVLDVHAACMVWACHAWIVHDDDMAAVLYIYMQPGKGQTSSFSKDGRSALIGSRILMHKLKID